MEWLRTDECKKQKKLNLKSHKSNRGKPQKRKANDKSVGGNWKYKFCTAIKIDQCLQSIMPMMASEEQNNRALISAFSVSNVQHSVPANQALI